MTAIQKRKHVKLTNKEMLKIISLKSKEKTDQQKQKGK